jgi:superfamily II RNA helicase
VITQVCAWHWLIVFGRTELKRLESQKKATKIEKREEVEEYYDLRQHLDDYAKDYRAVIQLPTYSLPFLQPGRLVQVQDGDRDFGWGAVIHFEKRNWPMVRVKKCFTAVLVRILIITIYFTSDQR